MPRNVRRSHDAKGPIGRLLLANDRLPPLFPVPGPSIDVTRLNADWQVSGRKAARRQLPQSLPFTSRLATPDCRRSPSMARPSLARRKGHQALELGDAETGLLEDCHEDWRALWEIAAGPPNRSIAECVAFLLPLIAGGYLTTLAVTAWEQARDAAPMDRDDALAVVERSENYTPPAIEGEIFYLLSITLDGEAAIPPGAFPND
jgi:hypothetical protein